MEHLVYSKQEVMKRKMLDLVDKVHVAERKELEADFNLINPEMRAW